MTTPPSKTVNALTQKMWDDLSAMMSGPPEVRQLENMLRHLAKWRAHLIENTITTQQGRTVQSGPFKGMDYDIPVTEGAAAARLLGCYEVTLVPVLEEIIARAYPVIMDIGCAEGYYAVGLALRMSETKVMAHDANPKAQKACAELAARNNVSDRVAVGGIITHTDFDRCADVKTCIICDIEGAEGALLDPEKAPGLRAADILVEVHDSPFPNLSKTIEARFAATHHIQKYVRSVDMSALPDWMEALSDLDRLLALWEWRGGPTPWLWMKSKDGAEM